MNRTAGSVMRQQSMWVKPSNAHQILSVRAGCAEGFVVGDLHPLLVERSGRGFQSCYAGFRMKRIAFLFGAGASFGAGGIGSIPDLYAN
jgi:hypothetical protein